MAGFQRVSTQVEFQRQHECARFDRGCSSTYAIFMPAGLDFRMDEMGAVRNIPDSYGAAAVVTTLYPGCGVLRRAIRRNVVSFPSRVPPLLKSPSDDMQWRVVLLYFVRGWSSVRIGQRFRVPKHRISQVLRDWSVRALAQGCLEVLNQEAFKECCLTAAGRGSRAGTGLFLAASASGAGSARRAPVVPKQRGASYAVA